MTSLFRVRTALTGFPGGPGVATMYFLDTNTAIPSVRAFWAALTWGLPLTVTAQVESVGDEIESTTGTLLGTFSKAAVLPVVGAATGNYAAPAGALVTWLTSTISDGKRLKGRTFIVPLAGSQFQGDGTLDPSALGGIATAAQALRFEQSLSMVVWHRPRAAKLATPTSPAVAFRAGSHGLVTAHRVPDKVVVLRSRRD